MAHRRQGNAPPRPHMEPFEIEEILQLLESMVSGDRPWTGDNLPDVTSAPALPPISTLEPSKRDEELPPGMGYVTGEQGARRPERFPPGHVEGPQIDEILRSVLPLPTGKKDRALPTLTPPVRTSEPPPARGIPNWKRRRPDEPETVTPLRRRLR